MKKVLAAIKRELKKARSAVVASHIDPDGDAIGSMLALGAVLEKLGIKVTYYCADSVPKIYQFLSGADQIKREIPHQQHFDLALVLDSSDLCRLGDQVNFRSIAKIIINIDHHPDNANFGDLNYVVRSACVAEQVYDLAKFLKLKITRSIAEALYAAIITDTGNFRYENTTVKTFQIAAALLTAGVNPHEITTKIYDTKSVASIKIAGRALAEIKFSADRRVTWTAVTAAQMVELGAKGEDLIGIVDRLRSVEGVEVAIFFREEKGKVKVNFRSKNKVNVAALARRFAGGGHFKAAGAVIPGPLSQVEEKVIKEVIKHLAATKYLV